MKTNFLIIPVSFFFILIFSNCKKEYYSNTEITAKFIIGAPDSVYIDNSSGPSDTIVFISLFDYSFGDITSNGGIYYILDQDYYGTLSNNVYSKTYPSIPVSINSIIDNNHGNQNTSPFTKIQLSTFRTRTKFCNIILNYKTGNYTSNYYQVIFDFRKFSSDYLLNNMTRPEDYIISQGDL